MHKIFFVPQNKVSHSKLFLYINHWPIILGYLEPTWPPLVIFKAI